MKAAALILAFFLFGGILFKLLVIALVWLAIAFAVGVLVGRFLRRRSADYLSPHFGPKPHLYDQDHEGR